MFNELTATLDKISSRRSGDVAVCYAKANKASRELSWTAKRDLGDMCASAWHFQSNYNKNFGIKQELFCDDL